MYPYPNNNGYGQGWTRPPSSYNYDYGMQNTYPQTAYASTSQSYQAPPNPVYYPPSQPQEETTILELNLGTRRDAEYHLFQNQTPTTAQPPVRLDLITTLRISMREEDFCSALHPFFRWTRNLQTLSISYHVKTGKGFDLSCVWNATLPNFQYLTIEQGSRVSVEIKPNVSLKTIPSESFQLQSLILNGKWVCLPHQVPPSGIFYPLFWQSMQSLRYAYIRIDDSIAPYLPDLLSTFQNVGELHIDGSELQHKSLFFGEVSRRIVNLQATQSLTLVNVPISLFPPIAIACTKMANMSKLCITLEKPSYDIRQTDASPLVVKSLNALAMNLGTQRTGMEFKVYGPCRCHVQEEMFSLLAQKGLFFDWSCAPCLLRF